MHAASECMGQVHLHAWDGVPSASPPPPPSRAWRRYIYSMYTSVTAFAGLGDGDFFTANAEENVAMSIYLLFNIVLGAYILGTVTMLMVKQDERSKLFRDQITNLKE